MGVLLLLLGCSGEIDWSACGVVVDRGRSERAGQAELAWMVHLEEGVLLLCLELAVRTDGHEREVIDCNLVLVGDFAEVVLTFAGDCVL